ncbi:hypothetical protein [Gordonia shandongensis]|uniref:hypothetical protein n=1 Tax=Gordonia shandongensis TaxID=376351 RepID=UPI00040E0299|nr:hypothetical protein [Gordonia shandongensis]
MTPVRSSSDEEVDEEMAATPDGPPARIDQLITAYAAVMLIATIALFFVEVPRWASTVVLSLVGVAFLAAGARALYTRCRSR